MPVASGFQELAATAWDWVKRDADLWLRAMGDLKVVLIGRDLESEDALLFAIRFSAFSFAVAIAVDYPALVFFTGKNLGLTDILTRVILYYVVTVCSAFSAMLMASIVLARRTFRVCLVTALSFSVYWPIYNLLDYILMSDKKLYTGIFHGGIFDRSSNVFLNLDGRLAASLFVLAAILCDSYS